MNVRYIKGVGPSKEKSLNRLGVYTVRDLLYYFPFRYEDRRNIKQIRDLKEGETALVKAKVLARNLKPFKHKKWWKGAVKNSIFEVVISDETSMAKCVWFNQGYLKDYIKVGDQLLIYGKFKLYKGSFQVASPEFEVLNNEEDNFLNVGRIVGFYRLSRGLTHKSLRKMIHYCIDNFSKYIDDALPYYIRKQMNIPNIYQSLRNIHFPVSFKEAYNARRRFIFEELFFSQILVYIRKARYRLRKSASLLNLDKLVSDIENNLPFSLTLSQKKAIEDIRGDLGKPHPMHRLLQGDVGSGKTIVACFALAAAVRNGYQAAFMAPTEVLVRQHLETLKEVFKGFGFCIKVLTSSLSTKEKENIYQGLSTAKIDIIIGTHSLIEDMVKFKKLGVVVIDEQHKFGVAQRALLPKKSGRYAAHCLVMSATPIPRSLALSLYGDLDISVIKELPPGRKNAETVLVGEEKRQWVYSFLKDKLKEHRQVYIVYPLIEDSDIEGLKSLSRMYDILKKEFAPYIVGVFHGRMKPSDKEKIVRDFKANKINILVSTTVIEVGVNIENATVMVVENPERFGLAQLHQLRGRIRRSRHKPYFIIISGPGINDNAKKRLQIISKLSDGFKIAEEDLKLRGPGDFFGLMQAGLPPTKISDPLKDVAVLKEARRLAYNVIKKDPYLKEPSHRCIREYLDYRMNR